MAKKSDEDLDMIPSGYWTNIKIAVVVVILIICMYLFVILSIWPENIELHRMIIPFVVIAGILFEFGKNYILTEKIIVCRIFSIPYRKIPWGNVVQAGIASTGSRFGYKYSNMNCIILTLEGCPKFQPGREWGGDYHLKHLRKTIQIYGEDREPLKKDVALIEKYYGVLDYGYDRLVR